MKAITNILLFLILIISTSAIMPSEINSSEIRECVTADSLRGKNEALVLSLDQFGKCTIFYKDGSKTTNALIKEIKSLHLIVLKDGNLHDVEIEKIKWAQSLKYSKVFLCFEENLKPFLWVEH